jgi:nitrate reductase NapE component
MDSIKFIPKNQKNLEELVEFKTKDKGQEFIYILFALFIFYTVAVVGSYWYFIVQEKNKVTRAIEELDSNNKTYYITDNLEQDLFNISSLIGNNYNIVGTIKSIESAYILGANAESFSYSKLGKSININMKLPSLNDITTQVDKFRELPVVARVNLSPVTYTVLDGFAFSIEIILK